MRSDMALVTLKTRTAGAAGCVHAYICVHACVRMCMHVSVCVPLYVYAYRCKYGCAYEHMCARTVIASVVAKVLYQNIGGRFRVHTVRVRTVFWSPNVDVPHADLNMDEMIVCWLAQLLCDKNICVLLPIYFQTSLVQTGICHPSIHTQAHICR